LIESKELMHKTVKQNKFFQNDSNKYSKQIIINPFCKIWSLRSQ